MGCSVVNPPGTSCTKDPAARGGIIAARMEIDPRLRALVARQPHPLVFATLSGAHLYGFPSPDSDFDVRGVHVLPARELLGMGAARDTIEVMEERDGLELDLVTHDAKKFFSLLLKRNGYVLEQLLSPLVVATTPEHGELKEIARGCITRAHAHHYLGFADTQRKLLRKKPRVKQALYLYRVLLTGIHLMRTGEVEANLVRLNESFRIPAVPDLIARKLAGPEKSPLDKAEIASLDADWVRLTRELEDAGANSTLPTEPSGRDALEALLLRLRLGR